MTSRPRLVEGADLVHGVAAALLFGVLAYVFVAMDQFEQPTGFGEESIVETIGFALLDLTDLGAYETEGFLVAFLVIALVLDAAVDGAIMLARREDDEGDVVTAIADGGRRLGSSVLGTDRANDADEGGER